ncbi:hypothetical protein [Hydrogenophaga sp. 2FB]|uniref:hypothetical protein n=1 Tax=Hydrogenophaga sp. 2FB TaxID=2502187 RepID=UPI0010FA09E1|nr:hypothetical protein [Hydrogenophaga sp. 2FB]
MPVQRVFNPGDLGRHKLRAAAIAVALCMPAAFSTAQQLASSSAGYYVNEIFLVHNSEETGGPVSTIEVPAMSMTPRSLTAALDLALSDKGMSVVIRAPLSQKKDDVLIKGSAGNLEKVLDQLASSLDFFWVAKDGVITIDGSRTFSLMLPKVAQDDRKNIEGSLITAGATDVRPLPLDNIILFRASPSSLESVRQVLEASSRRRGLNPMAVKFGPMEPVAKPAIVEARTPEPVALARATPIPPVSIVAAPTVQAPPAAQSDPAAPAAVSYPVETNVAVAEKPVYVEKSPVRIQPAIRAVRAPLVAAPAQASSQGVEPRFWSIGTDDRTVEGVMRRWARENGWSLRYEFERIPVLRPASVIASDFIGAAKQIQKQLVEAGYDMDLDSIGTTLRVSPGASK